MAMRVEDCLIELVCHARWLANMALTSVDPSIQELYPDDIDSARAVLEALSTSMGHIELLSEIPSCCISALFCGALYLLVGEAVMREVPPTLHKYLAQSSLRRHQSREQTQLLAVRWFVSSAIISTQDLLEVVFGPDNSVENYSSENEAHNAIAKALSESDPFYLGAHIVMIRGLLLRYCSSLITVEDVLSHVSLLRQERDLDVVPRTLEDALLLWMGTVFSLLEHPAPLASELAHVDDLYLHTNDGRVLSLVIHHYRPDLQYMANIHFINPVTVWQRQDNWSNIIRAAESMGLWVGIFADEMVAHGFSTLQLHVLRTVLELFAVLATQSEVNYMSLCNELNGDSEFFKVKKSNTMMQSLLPSSTQFEEVPKQQRKVVVSKAAPRQVSPHEAKEAAVQQQQEESHDEGGETQEDVEEADAPGNNDDDDGDGGGDDGGSPIDPDSYNVVLAGMFLQGVKMQIHPAAAPEAAAPKPNDNTQGKEEEQEAEAKPATQGGAGNDEEFKVSIHPTTTEECDDNVTTESPDKFPVDNGGATADSADRVQSSDVDTGDATPPSLIVNPAKRLFTSTAMSEDPAPPRSVSPSVPQRDKSFPRSRNDTNPLMQSVAYLVSNRPRTQTERRLGRSTVVQGSMDTEGVEALLKELADLSTKNAPPPPTTAEGGATVKEQNQKLRWALKEQQRAIDGIVTKLKNQIRKQELLAILGHLKGKRPTSSAIRPVSKDAAVGASFSVIRREAPTDTTTSTATATAAAPSAPRADAPPQQQQKSKAPQEQKAAPMSVRALSKPQESPSAPSPTSTGHVSEVSEAKGGQRFDVSLGGLAKGSAPVAVEGPTSAVPKLRLPQIEKLKERHALRRINSGAGSKLRSNKVVIVNALRYACLPGQVNKRALDSAMEIIEQEQGRHFQILLKDEFHHVFKGLYIVEETGTASRIFGVGPLAFSLIGADAASGIHAFRFDTGSKNFQSLTCHAMDSTVDAVAFTGGKARGFIEKDVDKGGKVVL